MEKSFFGTDGIRGEAGKFPLDEPTIYACARALARQLTNRLGRPPRVVTGRDPRESGRWIETIMTRGLHDEDAEVVSLGVMTTPGVAYVTRSHGFDAGVVISASHNQVPDNGIKIFSDTGSKLDDDLELSIEQQIEQFRTSPQSSGPTWLDFEEDLRRRYTEFLGKEVGLGLDLRGMSLVLDCANGAASDIAPALFTSLGAEVTTIAAEPDGTNINLDCGAVHIEKLSKFADSQSFDLGIAFDGDADRALFAGKDGRVFDGDHIMFIVANHFKQSGRLNGDLVVGTIMSNLGLEQALQERGIALYRTPVGDRFVLEKLLELGGSIGGEQSGHIIFPHISLAGDGLITAIEVLRIATQTGRDLYELSEGFTKHPQLLINIPVREKPPLETIPQIVSGRQEIEKQLEGRGRLLLRYSGTENKARVMVEADDAVLVETLAHRLAETIRTNLG